MFLIILSVTHAARHEMFSHVTLLGELAVGHAEWSPFASEKNRLLKDTLFLIKFAGGHYV